MRGFSLWANRRRRDPRKGRLPPSLERSCGGSQAVAALSGSTHRVWIKRHLPAASLNGVPGPRRAPCSRIHKEPAGQTGPLLLCTGERRSVNATTYRAGITMGTCHALAPGPGVWSYRALLGFWTQMDSLFPTVSLNRFPGTHSAVYFCVLWLTFYHIHAILDLCFNGFSIVCSSYSCS